MVDEQLDKSCGRKCAVCIWYLTVCILYLLFLLYGSVLTSGYIRGVVVQGKLSHAKGDLHTNLPVCPKSSLLDLGSGRPHFCLVLHLDSKT